jgi:cobalt-zinc-cadmium efflux system protein
MAHGHEGAQRNLGFALILNLVFAIAELVGGLLVNSMAIISDAIHDFGDVIAIGTALYLDKVSHKNSDRTFSYGYKRFSPLGAAINAIILTIGSVIVVIESVPRIVNPEVINSEGMLIIGVAGVIINTVAFLRVHKGDSLNEKAVSLHLLEDVLGWVAVLLGSVIIYYTQWYVVDSVLSILIAIFILYNAVKNLIKSMRIFLQAVPANINVEALLENTLKNELVHEIHDVRTWALDDRFTVLTMHVKLVAGEIFACF